MILSILNLFSSKLNWTESKFLESLMFNFALLDLRNWKLVNSCEQSFSATYIFICGLVGMCRLWIVFCEQINLFCGLILGPRLIYHFWNNLHFNDPIYIECILKQKFESHNGFIRLAQFCGESNMFQCWPVQHGQTAEIFNIYFLSWDEWNLEYF